MQLYPTWPNFSQQPNKGQHTKQAMKPAFQRLGCQNHCFSRNPKGKGGKPTTENIQNCIFSTLFLIFHSNQTRGEAENNHWSQYFKNPKMLTRDQAQTPIWREDLPPPRYHETENIQMQRKQPYSHPNSTFILLASAANPSTADNRPRNPTNEHNTRDLLSIFSLSFLLSPCQKPLFLWILVSTVESFLWYYYYRERWKRKARKGKKKKTHVIKCVFWL